MPAISHPAKAPDWLREKVCSREEQPADLGQIHEPDVSVIFVFDLYEAGVGERYKTTVARPICRYLKEVRR